MFKHRVFKGRSTSDRATNAMDTKVCVNAQRKRVVKSVELHVDALASLRSIVHVSGAQSRRGGYHEYRADIRDRRELLPRTENRVVPECACDATRHNGFESEMTAAYGLPTWLGKKDWSRDGTSQRVHALLARDARMRPAYG